MLIQATSLKLLFVTHNHFVFAIQLLYVHRNSQNVHASLKLILICNLLLFFRKENFFCSDHTDLTSEVSSLETSRQSIQYRISQ